MADSNPMTAITDFDSPALTFDLHGLRVGCAEYDEGPTGCTVFVFERGATTAVDIRGGAVGHAESDYQLHHAICFAGGSLHGLEAASGVRAALAAKDPKANPPPLPLVGAAVIYDWEYSDRDRSVNPDKALGFAAAGAATSGRFPCGRRGAGRAAGAGQGGAFREVGAAGIAVFTVVNAVGEIFDRQGRIRSGDGTHPLAALERRLGSEGGHSPTRNEPGKHTTLTLVATNQKWSHKALQQIGRQVHASMARAIQPFHTMEDGDLLFTASTGAVEEQRLASPTDFGMVASELAWDAVLKSIGE